GRLPGTAGGTAAVRLPPSGGRKGTGHQARSANDKAPRCGALYIHSAVAGQQRRLLATGAAVGQLVQLLQTGQAFAVLVDDQRLSLTAPRDGRHRQVEVVAAAAIGGQYPSATLALAATATLLAVLAAGTLGRRATTTAGPGAGCLAATTAAAGRTLAFGGRHVVDPVAEVVDLVVEEFLRIAIRGQRRHGRLLELGPTLAAATATLAGALAGRFRFGLLFAGGAGRPGLLLAPAGRGLRLLATALAATTRLARLAHLRRLRLQAGQVEAHQVAVGDALPGQALDGLEQ